MKKKLRPSDVNTRGHLTGTVVDRYARTARDQNAGEPVLLIPDAINTTTREDWTKTMFKHTTLSVRADDYVFKTTPFPHQLEAFCSTAKREFAALFLDMGLGKTKVTIDTACYLRQQRKIRALVVVAPKGMYHQWAKEWPLHAAPWPAGDFVYLWRPERTKKNLAARYEAERWGLGGKGLGFPVIIVNTEQFSIEGSDAVVWLHKFIRAREGEVLFVVDESSTVKNFKAARTKNITKLAGICDYRRILNGAPITRDPLDLWSQFKILSDQVLGSSYYQFRQQYAILKEQFMGGGRSFKVVVGFKHLEHLKERIAPYVFRRRLQDCIDLPPMIFAPPFRVTISKEQARIYESIRKNAYAVLDNSELVTMPLVLTQLLRLRQVLCGILPVAGKQNGETFRTFPDADNGRLKALEEWLDLCSVDPDNKVVIFTTFRPCVDMINRVLESKFGKDSHMTYVGGEPNRAGKQAVFNDPSGPLFFTATRSTAKYGLNLKASTVLYYDNDDDFDARTQSERRTYGIGRGNEGRSTVYTDFVVPGSIEEKILNRYLSKQKMSDFIIDDEWREWFKPLGETDAE